MLTTANCQRASSLVPTKERAAMRKTLFIYLVVIVEGEVI